MSTSKVFSFKSKLCVMSDWKRINTTSRKIKKLSRKIWERPIRVDRSTKSWKLQLNLSSRITAHIVRTASLSPRSTTCADTPFIKTASGGRGSAPSADLTSETSLKGKKGTQRDYRIRPSYLKLCMKEKKAGSRWLESFSAEVSSKIDGSIGIINYHWLPYEYSHWILVLSALSYSFLLLFNCFCNIYFLTSYLLLAPQQQKTPKTIETKQKIERIIPPPSW